MLSIGSVVVNVSDVRRAVDFWTAALDYVLRYPVEDDWAILRPRAGGGPNLSLNLGETRPDPVPHVHLDLYAGDHDDQSTEVRRLMDLGATHVEWDYPEDGDFVVLADPDGNRFCVIDTGEHSQVAQ